jgi:mannose-6-phosphate isomerase
MTVTEPLVFAPFLRPAIWGGRRLGELLSKPLPAEGRWGEAWEMSAHPGHVSVVAEGPLRGLSLSALARSCSAELFGGRLWGGFPLLLKFLDARDWLSLQVHPDDRRAPCLAGEPLGKTEAWVVIEAAPGALVYAGLRPGVARRDLEQAVRAGDPRECLHGFEPRPGDCLFLPAGTVHAAAGVVLAEVQQASDATLRLFDWGRVGADGRPRALHLEQALEAIDWRAGPVTPIRTQARNERLVRCGYFGLDRFRTVDALCSPYRGRAAAWMVLCGRAELRSGRSYRRLCRAGDTLLVPAAADEIEWQADGPVTLLAATLPRDGSP